MKEFLEWELGSEFNTVKNCQVMTLSKNTNSSIVEKRDLEIAKKRLASSHVIGVVERMDESLVLAEEFLRQYFNKIDLSYISQNVSPDRVGGLAERLRRDGEQVGDFIVNQLETANILDFELLSFANATLDERISKVDKFEFKLLDFMKRCKETRSKFQ